jgi:acyl-coenzyme A synthetase/AMP-(fatty) acid ligase
MASRLGQAAGIIATLRRARMIAAMRHPIEVEKALAAHSHVAEAAVIGVDDEQYGQRLAAFVVLAPSSSATPDSLKQHVRENLANYKVPRGIAILDELPRGSTGKILRAELQARVTG